MPSSTRRSWTWFWRWLSRAADVITVSGVIIVSSAGLLGVATAAWLFIKGVPPPVTVLASVGVFELVVVLLVQFVRPQAIHKIEPNMAPVKADEGRSHSSGPVVLTNAPVWGTPRIQLPRWVSRPEVIDRHQILFNLENDDEKSTLFNLRCIVQDPAGNRAVASTQPEIPVGGAAWFNYPKEFSGPGSVTNGPYRVIWESEQT